MGIYTRLERVRAKISFLVEGEKAEGMINFVTEDGAKRFADFDADDNTIREALEKAFNDNKFITLVLTRINSGRDKITKTEIE